jgi:hypothetical protein
MEEKNQIIVRANGIIVLHLKFFLDDRSHRPLDYHLHLLTFYDKEHKYTGVYCLDTRDIDTLPSPFDKNAIRTANEKLALDIARTFIDRVNSVMMAKLSNNDINTVDTIFDQADPNLWDKFNDIKKTTYVENMTRLYKSKLVNKIGIIGKTIEDKPDTVYDATEIRLAEERLILGSV